MCCRKISKSVRLCVFCCADVDDRKLQVLRLDLWILFRSRQIEDHRDLGRSIRAGKLGKLTDSPQHR